MSRDETTGPACHRETGPAIPKSLRQREFTATASVQRPAPRWRGAFPCENFRAFFDRPAALAAFLRSAQADGRRIARFLLPFLLLVPSGRA